MTSPSSFLVISIETFPPAEVDRFWAKVNTTGTCWEFQGGKSHFGHGRVYLGGRLLAAHRVSYALAYGAIPNDLLVCHHCDNPSCVRPDHLFLGTYKDNMRDCIKKGRSSNSQKHWLKPHVKKLSNAQREEVVKMYLDGEPVKQLARMYYVDPTTIRYHLKRAGVHRATS